MNYTVGKIAEIIGGALTGNADIEIKGAAGLDKAKQGHITFLSNDKYLNETEHTEASAILINKKYVDLNLTIPTISVDNVYTALAEILNLFDESKMGTPGIHPMAYASDKATIDSTAHIGPSCIIEDQVTVGAKTQIMGQVYLGKNVTIGANCIIYPGVKVYHDCHIGDNCILHANAIIGADGFGFAPQADGTFVKIPQIGNVILEDHVEIGANTVVDRATMNSTIIRKGVKLDNLIQVGHNVEIGENTVIAALTGIAGSAKIGKQCQIGGQVGISGHITVPDRTMIQAQSGVTKGGKLPGQKLSGSPAVPYNNFVKSFVITKNLPDLQARIRKLEKQLEQLVLSSNPKHEAKDDSAKI